MALDAGAEAVEGAVAAGCQLLITHHPFIFKPLKKISLADPVGKLLSLAIKNDLAVISLHTNFDVARGGVNDLLAELLGVESCEPLKVTSYGRACQALGIRAEGERGAGDWRPCSGSAALSATIVIVRFSRSGIGTFTPLAGAEPFIGEVGKREYAEETRRRGPAAQGGSACGGHGTGKGPSVRRAGL